MGSAGRVYTQVADDLNWKTGLQLLGAVQRGDNGSACGGGSAGPEVADHGGQERGGDPGVLSRAPLL